jgi:hypothetical protein
MIIYEYKQEEVKPDSLAQLNEEGSRGWEFVMQATDVVNTVITRNGPVAKLVFIFKRKRKIYLRWQRILRTERL